MTERSQEDIQLAVGTRLSEELARVGLGVTATAQLLEVARNTVYAWFESGGITAWQLAVLAEHGFDPTYITTGTRSGALARPSELSSEDVAWTLSPMAQEQRERAAKYGAHLTVEEALQLVQDGEYVWVPFYDVPLSGGGGADFMEVPAKWNFYRRDYIVEERGLNPIDLAEFPVRGPSMSPVLNSKDTVLIDRASTEVVAGDIYAFRVGNVLYIKFLQVLPDGNIQATSKQPEYQPFTVLKAELDSNHAAIIGRLCRQSRDN